MTALLQTGIELFIQISLWSMVGIVLLVFVSRYWPLRLASVAFCFLAGVVLLTVLAWVPWPGWVSTALPVHVAIESPSTESFPMDSSTGLGPGVNLLNVWKAWQSLVPQLTQGIDTAQASEGSGNWQSWIFMILLAGILLGLIRFSLVVLRTRAIVLKCRTLKDGSILQLRDELSQQLKLTTDVELLESPTILVPATLGYWKPVILLPACWTVWSKSECQTVLAHELAHIRRTDYLMMVMAQFVTIFYWFHPLVLGLSRWMRSGQELAADALAVRVLGDRPMYLRSLCRLALYQDGTRLSAPARLFLSPEVSFLRRVAMLREGSQQIVSSRWARWLLLALLVGTGCFIATLRSSAYVRIESSVKPADTKSGWEQYVAADIPGYGVVYPAAALRMDSSKELREKINQYCMEKMQLLPGVQGMGIPMDGIECFGGPLAIQLRIDDKPGTGSMSCASQYLRFIDAATMETWLKHNTLNITKVDLKHGSYYQANCLPLVNQDGVCFIQPDERTIVFAPSEAVVQQWLSPAYVPNRMPWASLMPREAGLASVFINMQHPQLQKAIAQAKSYKNGTDSSAINPMLKPLYEHEGCIACTLLKQDKLALDFSMTCANADAATAKKKQIDALVSVFKVVRVSGTTNEKAEEEAHRQQMLHDLLNNVQSKVDGSTLYYSTHCEQLLGGILAGEVLGMFGSPAK